MTGPPVRDPARGGKPQPQRATNRWLRWKPSRRSSGSSPSSTATSARCHVGASPHTHLPAALHRCHSAGQEAVRHEHATPDVRRRPSWPRWRTSSTCNRPCTARQRRRRSRSRSAGAACRSEPALGCWQAPGWDAAGGALDHGARSERRSVRALVCVCRSGLHGVTAMALGAAGWSATHDNSGMGQAGGGRRVLRASFGRGRRSCTPPCWRRPGSRRERRRRGRGRRRGGGAGAGAGARAAAGG